MRSIERKIVEAYLALWLENQLTKKQILQLYLDRTYMGAGAFGVQAAAETYFGKSARDIDLAEAAMLAGLFKAPTDAGFMDRRTGLTRRAATRLRRSSGAASTLRAGVPTGIWTSPFPR